MTDSHVRTRRGKRERLISAAADLVYRHGVQATTLAEIAEAADVPPGNVYYYFKTRDDLIRAVIDSWARQIATVLDSIGQLPDPGTRLRALARTWSDKGDLIAESGCPIGSLCTELNKQDHGLGALTAGLFVPLIAWAADQFRQMGRADAEELAVTLLSTVEGAALLASNLRDPDLLSRQICRLERWIDSLSQ